MTRVVPLGSVADIQMGSAPPGESYNDAADGMPMIAGAGDYGKVTPTPKKWTTAPTVIAAEGDLIICVRATIGDLNWSDQRYCLGRGVAGVRARPGIADLRYLAHYIARKKPDLNKLGTGSTFKAIRRADLEDFPVILPPLKEQRRIAAILDRADAVRRKRREAIELTETLLRSVFLDMFGDPVTNPKGWQIVSMAELFKVSPNYGTMKVPSDISGKWLDLRVANIQEGVLNLSSKKFVDLEPKETPRHTIVDGDILLARAIGSRDHLGKCFVAYPGPNHWAFDSHLMRLRLDNSLVEPEYMQAFLSSAGGRHEFLKHTRRSAVQFNINTKEVAKIQVPLPPINLQQKFVRTREAIRSTNSKLIVSAQTLESLANSLARNTFQSNCQLNGTEQTLSGGGAIVEL